MTEIYKKLAKHLNNTPGGFPETESGVELRILKIFLLNKKLKLLHFL